jgi:hypothetical protein
MKRFELYRVIEFWEDDGRTAEENTEKLAIWHVKYGVFTTVTQNVRPVPHARVHTLLVRL